MPSTITVGRTYRTAVGFTGQFRPAANVWYLQAISQVGAGLDDVGTANAMLALFGPLYAAVMTDSASVASVQLQDWTTRPPHPIAIDSTGAATPGTRGNSPLPTQTSGILTLQTLIAGRAFRGRKYLPFPDETTSTGTSRPAPTGAYLTSAGNIAIFFTGLIPIVTGGNGWNFTAQLWHKETWTFTPLAAIRVNPYWATQRRRGQSKVAHR